MLDPEVPKMTLLKRETRAADRIDRWETLDRLFEDWAKVLPFRRPLLDALDDEVIRVDEFHEDGALVIRAEMPGVDPDKDVEVTIADGMLHIKAERREEERTEEKDFVRRELRVGSFSRVLPVPAGVTEADVKATYRDGMLEIRVPAPAPAPTDVRKVEITKG
jgi:HSP20 family protein